MLTAVAALLAIGPAGALAASLSPDNYTAEAGEANNLTVTDNGGSLTFVDQGATIFSTGCTPAGPNPPSTPVNCPQSGVSPILLIDLDDRDDQTTFVGQVNSAISQFGGLGADTLRGSSASLSNRIEGEGGADDLVGGSDNHDQVDYGARLAPIKVSLDGQANDGEGDGREGDNVRNSVEDVSTGSANDTVTGNALPNTIRAAAGDDTVRAGAGNDVVVGDTGNDSVDGEAGNDTVDGGPGRDVVAGGDGDDALLAGAIVNGVGDGVADTLSGGPGIDEASITPSGPAPAAGVAVTISLDDLGNDGVAGEGDNYGIDIENVVGNGANNYTLIGSAAINVLTTAGGSDSITGGPGNDILTSKDGNDTIQSRDGFADRVACGAGADTAIVDTLDQVSDCENVQVADVGNAAASADDRPPTVAFTSPAQNALIRGGPSTVTVNASDDKGVARVLLIDDGRVVGNDETAPYSFVYRPKADDIGRDTLIAQAVDGANQTATAIRAVRVDRFVPRLSATVTPRRDRTLPFRFRTRGTLTLPEGVSRARGCSGGTVSVQVKRGSRTISTRRTKLRRRCSYSTTVTLTDWRRVGNGRLKVRARFGGNNVLKARSSRSRSVRAG
jgi:Ca2+-binding RTX toxin-like protein